MASPEGAGSPVGAGPPEGAPGGGRGSEGLFRWETERGRIKTSNSYNCMMKRCTTLWSAYQSVSACGSCNTTQL